MFFVFGILVDKTPKKWNRGIVMAVSAVIYTACLMAAYYAGGVGNTENYCKKSRCNKC